MKQLILFILAVCSSISVNSQTPLDIGTIINDLNWEDCSESDLIFTYKDNVVKRDKEDEFDGPNVSSYILKGVKVGNHTSKAANIIVNKFNRKIARLSIIFENLDWNKNIEDISTELENILSSHFGKAYKKTIEYRVNWADKKSVYPVIECEWDDTLLNEKLCKSHFLLNPKMKVAAISIEPKD